MDEQRKRQYAYLVALPPLMITTMQVMLGHAPLAMLAFGAAVAVVAFVLFRFLSGIRVFAPGRRLFGVARELRGWQAPALWIPVAVSVGAVIFAWMAR